MRPVFFIYYIHFTTNSITLIFNASHAEAILFKKVTPRQNNGISMNPSGPCCTERTRIKLS
jgi:hypothetical protein